MIKNFFSLFLIFIALSFNIKAQYIAEVIEYTPAPGQFINKAPWGNSASKTSIVGKVNGSMSLGGFGGYVVFKFENPVQNHPDNPYGIDFTIFGNPLGTWSEPGVVYVMKDENGNGLPDDTWYELAGSDYFFSTTKHNYEVTYTNPKEDVATDVLWTDNYGGSGVVLANNFHKQPYYPLSTDFSHINQDQYTLSGTCIDGGIDKTNPSYITSSRKAFGYVDNQLRGKAPYTVPDNPYTPEVENAGADAFDISWAVDANGNYVDLDKIHFIKVQCAINEDAGWLGEVSTEITGAAVVEPDASITGEMDLIVVNDIPSKIEGDKYQLEAFAFNAGRVQKDRKLNWTTDKADAYVDDNNVLHFESSGAITITASIQDRPDISASVSTELMHEKSVTSVNKIDVADFQVYPNPAKDYISITLDNISKIELYNSLGIKVLIKENISKNEKINISHLNRGYYILKVSQNNNVKTIRIIKQ